MVATVKVCKYTTRYTRPIDTKVTWDGLQWDIYIYIYIYMYMYSETRYCSYNVAM